MTPRDATKEPCSLAELFASWGPVQLINPHEPRAFTKLAARYADLLQLIHRLEARCAPSASGTPVAYIEHHKGGDNLVWDQTKERCTPLYKSAPAALAPIGDCQLAGSCQGKTIEADTIERCARVCVEEAKRWDSVSHCEAEVNSALSCAVSIRSMNTKGEPK